MVATPNQGGPRPTAGKPSATRVVVGFTLMFAGVALMSYGAHFVTKTGTCSGTGYVSYGPVAKCPGGEALYITSAFFLGPVVAIVGWLMARAWGWLWPTICFGVGAGLVLLASETTASTGARGFGGVSGVCLFALGGLSVFTTLRKRRRPPQPQPHPQPGAAAGPGITVLPSAAAPTRLAPVATRAATADRSDPLATIARLAQLRDSGALTEDEFEIQKAKLLAEI